ncbi:hypothetical protein ANN_02357 [Periplaneta americana]|uniref:Uncharacterized protein n=1 Tax=Periplaneta americana TaxID=6978 RepID=A0ABQ8TXT9_PERAM|nr:hypothetical protein ANN_02357 [Periplaneta americana]
MLRDMLLELSDIYEQHEIKINAKKDEDHGYRKKNKEGKEFQRRGDVMVKKISTKKFYDEEQKEDDGYEPVHVQNGPLPPQYTPNNDVQESDIPTGLFLMEYHYRHVQSELPVPPVFVVLWRTLCPLALPTEHITNANHTYRDINTDMEILHIQPKSQKLNTLEQYEIYRHTKTHPNDILNAQLNFKTHTLFDSTLRMHSHTKQEAPRPTTTSSEDDPK